MRLDVLTLFPEMCRGPLSHSIIGRARERGLIDVGLHDIRSHGLGRHRQVDDTPYGGGSGMVMRVDVVAAALSAVRRPEARVLLMDPAGRPFAQGDAVRLAREEHLIFICGHYEGVDARVREHLVDEALSIGDYVLTGGELPALVMIDAISRMIPGVLGNPESLAEESFTDGRLEGPVYTRPVQYEGWEVPEILRSGHHGKIREWRDAEALRRTRQIRPDLLRASEPDEG